MRGSHNAISGNRYSGWTTAITWIHMNCIMPAKIYFSVTVRRNQPFRQNATIATAAT
jgi:hypothetical protein